jgi:hypothetical protein
MFNSFPTHLSHNPYIIALVLIVFVASIIIAVIIRPIANLEKDDETSQDYIATKDGYIKKVIIDKGDYIIDFDISFNNGVYRINDHGSTYEHVTITENEFKNSIDDILKKYDISFKNQELFTDVENPDMLKEKENNFIKALRAIYEKIL